MTYTYDSDRRLVERVSRMTNGMVQATTHTARDPAGRPLRATHTTPGSTHRLSYSYDDQGRTTAITGPIGVQTHTFHANGNLIREIAVGPAGTSTYATTIDRTDKVCR